MPTFNGSSTTFCGTALSLTGSDAAWGPAAGAALPAPPSSRAPGWPEGCGKPLGQPVPTNASAVCVSCATGLVGRRLTA